jgi:hypothetical protein
VAHHGGITFIFKIMNKKQIYWGLGILAVSVGGYFAYKKFVKKTPAKDSEPKTPFFPTPTGEAPKPSTPFPFLVPDKPAM